MKTYRENIGDLFVCFRLFNRDFSQLELSISQLITEVRPFENTARNFNKPVSQQEDEQKQAPCVARCDQQGI